MQTILKIRTSSHLSPSMEFESSIMNIVLYFRSNSKGSSTLLVELDLSVALLGACIRSVRNEDVDGVAGSITTRACFLEPMPSSLRDS